MDDRYCVLLVLAVHIETFLDAAVQGGLTPYVFGFRVDITVPFGGVKTKDKI